MSPLLSRYNQKVIAPAELRSRIGDRPREKKVVMCHGVFDVVHPGHLRHLMYAKERADILVVSLTSDHHVTKGPLRPHVPQDLRAVSLAAYEMVDFVIIDKNPTPVANILLIEPDYFAKGFEYAETEDGSRTSEEAAAVKSYGGEFVFTPGDIVYSSSKLISSAAPQIRLEKLLMALERRGVGFDQLRAALAKMRGIRVHVVGDLIVDTLTRCTMIGGGATKTPTMSVRFEREEHFVGGAGIVAKHLAAAGAEVHFDTVLGSEDRLHDFALKDLEAAGVGAAVYDDGRPVTNKNAICVGPYRLLKIDTVDNRSVDDGIVGAIRRSMVEVAAEAVVFSDFRHGIFNKRTTPALIEGIPVGVLRVGDSQVASRWGNILEFQGFDLITPNEREARFALGDQESGIRPLSSMLYNAAKCKLLILKLAENGIIACLSEDHEEPKSFIALDSFAGTVVDAVGAGDALLAYATLALAAGAGPIAAAVLGNLAAAVECELDGNIPVTTAEVGKKIDQIEGAL